MRATILISAAVAALALCVGATAAPSQGSCLFSYETAGDLYASTLYIYDVRQKAVRIDIVDTDTETVLHQVFAYGSYVSLEEYLSDIDETTEFAVYANSVKPESGGSGKLLAECYA